jgi:hypothetical protein
MAVYERITRGKTLFSPAHVSDCMSDREMLSAQVSKDSALLKQFKEYKERNGFENRSEALRAALRQGIEADTEPDPPTGPAAALSKIAGEQLTEQLGVLSRYIIALAVSLMAIEFGVPGGVLWFIPVVFFGFLVFTTVLGVGVGFAEVLDVKAGQSASGSSSDAADEVEA